jgi:hypothetical protein
MSAFAAPAPDPGEREHGAILTVDMSAIADNTQVFASLAFCRKDLMPGEGNGTRFPYAGVTPPRSLVCGVASCCCVLLRGSP